MSPSLVVANPEEFFISSSSISLTLSSFQPQPPFFFTRKLRVVWIFEAFKSNSNFTLQTSKILQFNPTSPPSFCESSLKFKFQLWGAWLLNWVERGVKLPLTLETPPFRAGVAHLQKNLKRLLHLTSEVIW
jgi:hypothetical protein